MSAARAERRVSFSVFIQPRGVQSLWIRPACSMTATPAIADDKLYIRTASHLWAFGE